MLTRRVVISLVGVIALGTAAAPTVAADPLYVGWSNLLPGWAYSYDPSSRNDCAAGRPTCVRKTIKQMQRRFNPLAASCHHNAIFALAYLRTTQEYARAAAEPGFFQDPAFVNHEDAVFAQFYFDGYDRWTSGGNPPEAWQIAFQAAQERKVSAAGNLLLGMSAHVNRDLPFVLAAIGLTKPDGSSRKPDHDKVNVMLNRVVQPLMAELARRFDPTIDDSDATGSGISYTAAFQLLAAWREQAWRNAERLVAAPDEAARRVIAQKIEDSAAATARSLVAQYSYPPGTTSAARDAYCASHG